MIQRIDIKTWVIIVLGIIVLLMSLFGKSAGNTDALEALLDERDQQNAALQERIDARADSIRNFKDTAEYYIEQDRLKADIIVELEAERYRQQIEIDGMKRRMKESSKPIEDATDEKRIEFWRQYFLRKGIRQ